MMRPGCRAQGTQLAGLGAAGVAFLVLLLRVQAYSISTPPFGATSHPDHSGICILISSMLWRGTLTWLVKAGALEQDSWDLLFGFIPSTCSSRCKISFCLSFLMYKMEGKTVLWPLIK